MPCVVVGSITPRWCRHTSKKECFGYGGTTFGPMSWWWPSKQDKCIIERPCNTVGCNVYGHMHSNDKEPCNCMHWPCRTGAEGCNNTVKNIPALSWLVLFDVVSVSLTLCFCYLLSCFAPSVLLHWKNFHQCRTSRRALLGALVHKQTRMVVGQAFVTWWDVTAHDRREEAQCRLSEERAHRKYATTLALRCVHAWQANAQVLVHDRRNQVLARGHRHRSIQKQLFGQWCCFLDHKQGCRFSGSRVLRRMYRKKVSPIYQKKVVVVRRVLTFFIIVIFESCP